MKPDLTDLVNIALSSPPEIREYCHYDGCPTTWYRANIKKGNVRGDEMKYVCGDCAWEKFYKIERIKSDAS